MPTTMDIPPSNPTVFFSSTRSEDVDDVSSAIPEAEVSTSGKRPSEKILFICKDSRDEAGH